MSPTAIPGNLILQSPTANDSLLDLNTQPSLDLQFATSKTLNDRVSGQNLITFSRSTTGTYVDSNGIIQTAAIDAPRFDHDPTTGESLGLLIEEGRTNLLLNSETLVTQSVTVTAVAHTLSFYGNGTVTLSGTHSATVVGTGGYPTRTTLTFTPTAGSLTVVVSGTVQYAQLEAGAFPTSYIPTSGSTVPRAADDASITGSNFSRWYNQSEGSTLINYNAPNAIIDTDYPRLFAFNSGVATDFSAFAFNGVNNSMFVNYVTNSSVKLGVSTTLPENSNGTAALAYQDNNSIAFLNENSSTQGRVAGPMSTILNRLDIGGDSAFPARMLNGTISRLTYYPYRLPDATLQEITS